MESNHFFNRDLSWLSFNGRVMDEAANDSVPLLERFKFLSIFSSNLDEFYRVRMPVLRALKKIGENDDSLVNGDEHAYALDSARNLINQQQNKFGTILREQLLPQLKAKGVHLLYNEPFPAAVKTETTGYFLAQILAFLQPVDLLNDKYFFPENNKLYFIINMLNDTGDEKVVILNIPSDELPRFFTVKASGVTYITLLDDIIRNNLHSVFKNNTVQGCYSIKITRDAELDLKDEYSGEISDQIDKQLKKRDFGLATRFLYQAGIPLRLLQLVVQQLQLQNASITEGGSYHNLKDFFGLDLKLPAVSYDAWPAINSLQISLDTPLSLQIKNKDLLLCTPYQSYNPVLRFFNEAAANPDVTEIYVTLYRVASDSKIVHALISAAKNGKSVNVVIELKARFDEANNLRWAKIMKEAGVKISYSITALKVHAKMALVKTSEGHRTTYTGLLATGNFNEQTACFYTDYILFTANANLLREMELLFIFLARREKPLKEHAVNFKYLMVAQFNLQTRFLELIEREIQFAKQGMPASIILKLNNLEEEVLINKLYEASQAGVKIWLVIRSICRLIPGVVGISENITIKRIVDRYLEHGRAFIFNNNGNTEVYLGSADWMNRNIYNRIEVCFPVTDEAIKAELLAIINLQLADNVQAVYLNERIENVPVATKEPALRSQKEIYQLLTQMK